MDLHIADLKKSTVSFVQYISDTYGSLLWRHNGHGGVSNH